MIPILIDVPKNIRLQRVKRRSFQMLLNLEMKELFTEEMDNDL